MRLERQLCHVLRSHLSGSRAPVPEAGRIAWGWFIDLCCTRTSNGFGPNPISYAEIEAYARLTRWPLEPRHIALIRAMDDVWLEHARKTLHRGEEKPAPSSAPKISPQAFDAVFS